MTKIYREPSRLKRWFDRQFIYGCFPDGTEIREPKGRWVIMGFIALAGIGYGIVLVVEAMGRGTPV
jgi:hypothetical protein